MVLGGTGEQALVEQGLPPREALDLALTAEGLLFAAFAVAVSLSLPVQGGRRVFFAQGYFGYVVVAAIALVSLSAGAAWWATFSPDWPSTCNERLRAGGLAVAILCQPVFAWIINGQARKG